MQQLASFAESVQRSEVQRSGMRGMDAAEIGPRSLLPAALTASLNSEHRTLNTMGWPQPSIASAMGRHPVGDRRLSREPPLTNGDPPPLMLWGEED